MIKHIFFIHGAGPQNSEHGSGRLVSQLSLSLGNEYRVHAPIMPEPENPRYLEWKMTLQSTLPVGGNKAILIGHSLGGSVIVKYLSEGLVQFPLAGLFLIAAPYWGTRGWSMDEFMFEQGFQSKLPDIERIFIYHSRHDKWVPYSHSKMYTKVMPAAILRSIDGDDHEFKNGLTALVKDIQSLW